ncbi:glycosyl hydrolase family 76-domain-containing protein [Tricladium varicosporioides]|nr:glycosyl hydrolase family 76-domain-containing protein [Hymenoscyphus varicosporioides]
MRISNGGLKALLVWVLNIKTVFSITVDLTSNESVKVASQTCATGMLQNYTAEIPGVLGSPYSWSTAATVFGSLVDYWYYTGDDKFNNITTDALLNQAGESYKFIPTNGVQGDTSDQALWGLVVMSAAEYGFPAPPAGKPSWASMANAVFEDQVSRWDTSTCGGGLSYQVFGDPVAPGFKVAFSNARFGSLAARLGAYTGYFNWANKTWNWVTSSSGLASSDYHFYLNSSPATNCTSINHLEWTAVSGTYLTIAATMWNSTQQDAWQDRINGIIRTSLHFFNNGIMNEVACEGIRKCDLEQLTYKGQFARSLAITNKVAPFAKGFIMPLLRSSARGAAAQCVGGPQSNLCGFLWNTTYDGTAGPGQQMSALQVIQANLVVTVVGPLQGSLSTSNGSTSATPTLQGSLPTSNGSTSATPTAPPVNSTSKLSKGSIAGIVIGSLLGVTIATGVVFLFIFKQKSSTDKNVNSQSEAWLKPELDGNVKTSTLYELEYIQPQELPDNQLLGELRAPGISSEHPIPQNEVEHALNRVENSSQRNIE